jgi:hypothetical protein
MQFTASTAYLILMTAFAAIAPGCGEETAACAELSRQWQQAVSAVDTRCEDDLDCVVAGGSTSPCSCSATLGSACDLVAVARADYRASGAEDLELEFRAAECPSPTQCDCPPAYASCSQGMCRVTGTPVCVSECPPDSAATQMEGQLLFESKCEPCHANFGDPAYRARLAGGRIICSGLTIADCMTILAGSGDMPLGLVPPLVDDELERLRVWLACTR